MPEWAGQGAVGAFNYMRHSAIQKFGVLMFRAQGSDAPERTGNGLQAVNVPWIMNFCFTSWQKRDNSFGPSLIVA